MDASLEQVVPHGSGPDIIGFVIEDLESRAKVGEKRYGERLKAFNGRNALLDAYQEALDLCMYLRQKLYEEELYNKNDEPIGNWYKQFECK